MKKSFLFLFLILAQITYGQTIYQSIRGKVIDKDSKQPLPGASVILQNSNPIMGVITNAEGEFSMTGVPIGRQSLSISFIGYHSTEVKNLLLQSGKESIVYVELSEKVENISAVEVKAYREDGKALNEMAPVSARSFSIEQTERFAGSLGDPARMVGNYAGVVMQNDSRNDIIIRGNSPIGVIWRLDDIEIPNPNHFGALGTTGGPVSMLNNNLLTNSDFFTSAFPAELGNGISGAFDLRMRSGNNEKTEFTGQIGFNGFEAGIEGPFSKNSRASYMIYGRYSTLALMHKLGFGTGTGSAVPYYKDVTFKVDLPTQKAGKFALFGIIGDSDIDLGADIGDTAATGYNLTDQHTTYGSKLAVVGFSHLYFFNTKTRIKTTLSGQVSGDNTAVDTYKLEENRVEEYYRSDNTHTKYTLASHLKSKINRKNNLSLGFSISRNQLDYLDSVFINDYGRFVTIHNTDGFYNVYRPYAQYQYKFNDNLSIYGGLTMLANSINDDMAIEPRTGLEWTVNAAHSLSLGFGKHSQMQPASVYYLQYDDTVSNQFLQTNLETGLTKANHYVLGYTWNINTNIRLKAESYYQHIYNVPVSPSLPEFSMINAGEFFNIPTTDSLQNTGKGRNVGVELTFEKFLKDGYYILFTTSLFDSKYTGYDGVWRNTAFNSNYVFNLLAGYEFKIKSGIFITLDTKTVYSGGKRYIPVDLAASIQNDELTYDYSNAYKERLDDYFRTDLRIGIKINGKKFSQEWGIDFQNLTGHQAAFQQGYDSNKKEVYFNYQQGFYPMFLYRVQF